ncbi:MAG: hypothetical protein P8N19_11460 [Flavobacteriales bacterium]|nr:hypothetical protein [Flavobacteriales bacterium]
MNKEAKEGYINRRNSANKDIARLKKRLQQLVVFRLLSFSVFVLGVYLSFTQGTIFSLILLLGLLAFLFLVKRHKLVKQSLVFQKALKAGLDDELAVMDGALPNLSVYEAELPPRHPFAHDLDLFGANSIFHLLNRCYTIDGKALLAKRISTIDASEPVLQGRQALCKEASKAHEWRLQMRAAGSLLQQTHAAMLALKSWCSAPVHRQAPAWTKLAMYVAPVYSVLAILGAYFGVISISLMLLLFIIPMSLVGSRLKIHNELSNNLGHTKQSLDTLQHLFNVAPQVPNDAPHLKQLADEVVAANKAIKELAGIVEMFDQRNNLLAVIVLNALFVQDLRSERRLMSWLENHGVHLNTWLSILAELEMLSSLGTWAHHVAQESVYPSFDDSVAVQAEQLKHPFMLHSKGVSNAVDLPEFPSFNIITGANMAGKSTYLRTVGCAYVMANTGLPVMATSFVFSAAPLFTSMRTTDSLQEGKSYFLSELERLAQLISMAKQERPMVVLLDEILKGTNSNDKASGSQSFVRQLMKYKVAGMVATHDLSLCSITQDYPKMKNVHFAADIKGDDLSFDYRLKPGVCDTMNATFLMKKLGIIDVEL